MKNLEIKAVQGTEKNVSELIETLIPRVVIISDEFAVLLLIKHEDSSEITHHYTTYSGSLNYNNGKSNWNDKYPYQMTNKAKALWDTYLDNVQSLFLDWIKNN